MIAALRAGDKSMRRAMFGSGAAAADPPARVPARWYGGVTGDRRADSGCCGAVTGAHRSCRSEGGERAARGGVAGPRRGDVGTFTVALAEAADKAKPYETRTVRRDTTWGYDAGKTVHELVDPEGAVYDMQSYSVQEVQQDEASLAKLGETLTLPDGWAFRTRVIDEKLEVEAVDGLAVVVQDDFGNTYQRSQQ